MFGIVRLVRLVSLHNLDIALVAICRNVLSLSTVRSELWMGLYTQNGVMTMRNASLQDLVQQILNATVCWKMFASIGFFLERPQAGA